MVFLKNKKNQTMVFILMYIYTHVRTIKKEELLLCFSLFPFFFFFLFGGGVDGDDDDDSQ